MDILDNISLESNKQIKINFDGGDLSSDAGLILIKEFAYKLGFISILQSMFKTNDPATFRLHKDDQNLWQIIYQILGAYFEDDCSDELTNDPILTAILEKKTIASQPTLVPAPPQCAPISWRCPYIIPMNQSVTVAMFLL